MANYYTEASFIIPCTKEQAEVAIEAIELLDDESEYQPGKNAIADRLHESIDLDSLPLQFSVAIEEKGIWVTHDESINTEHAALFTQAVLKEYDISALVAIEAAHTCDKPRLDAFGGHAVVVTKDYIRWGGAADFLNAERDAHEKGERYFVCKVEENLMGLEFPNTFLIKTTGEEDQYDKSDKICRTFRDSSDVECSLVGLTEVTPLEYQTLSQHLPTL